MKKFKEFLEKRWWQGVGGIAGLVALVVLAVLQFRGIVHISGLAVSIAVNIILAIALALVAVRATRWKRKYERVSGKLEEIKGLVEEQREAMEEQREAMRRKRVFLPDPNNVSKLNIDNDLLNELYGQAYSRAVSKYHDAKLSSLTILVYPYKDDRVSIHFNFYSQWAGRQCTLMIGEIGDMRESLPNKPTEGEATFEELPWVRDPNWPQFLKKSCEKVGPLPPAPGSDCFLLAEAGGNFRWRVAFEDGVTGKVFWLRWDGKGEPILEQPPSG